MSVTELSLEDNALSSAIQVLLATFHNLESAATDRNTLESTRSLVTVHGTLNEASEDTILEMARLPDNCPVLGRL